MTHCETSGKRFHMAQKSARGFRRSMFGSGRTTGVKTSDCGKPLASARTGSMGGVDKNLT